MITYHNIDVEKYKFYQHKNPILIYDVNIDRIVASNKVLFGEKSFKFLLGCEDDSEKNYALMYNTSKNEYRKKNF